MKLISLYVKAFGKLKNFTYDFNSGINVIRQNNGFGKTTLACFIRAMLYGFKKKTTSVSDSRYFVSTWMPWDGGSVIGGYMLVEKGGVLYRIERYFTAKDYVGKLNFTLEKTAKPVKTDLSVGEFLLGLTAESFDRSAYFPQEAVTIQTNDNFEARLAGMVQNAKDFAKVQSSLDEYCKNISSTRRNALVTQLEGERYTLQGKISQCERAKARHIQIETRLAEIKARNAQLKEEVQNLNNRQSTEQNAAPSKEQEENRQKLQQLKEKLARMGNFPQDKQTCDELAAKIAAAPEVATKQRPIKWKLLCAGLGLLAAGIGVCFLQLIVGICLAVAGAVVSALAFFVGHPITTLPSGEKDAWITQYFNIAQGYVYCNGLSYDEVQKALWQAYNDYLGDVRLCQALESALAALPNTKPSEEIHARILRCQQELENLSKEEGGLVAEQKLLETDSLPHIEKLKDVEEQIRQAKHRYEVGQRVLSLLNQAKENLSTSYLPKLCEGCQKLLNQITGESYQVALSKEFSVGLRVDGVTQSLDTFSRGIREIVLLCFRIALSSLLFGGEIPFLMLDDALVNFDEDNFLRATKLIKTLSQKTQVVYFTCLERSGSLSEQE